MITLCVFLIFATGTDVERLGYLEERVDLIEYNHYYDRNGEEVLQQLIFYEWDESCSRFMVKDWRLTSKSAIPQPSNGEWMVVFYDGDFMRVIRSANLRVTHTRHDPELAERSLLPRPLRSGLRARNELIR